MDIKNLKYIKDQLIKNPLLTILSLIVILVVFCVGAYLTGLFTEKGKQAAIPKSDLVVQENKDKLAQMVEVNENQIIINGHSGVNALKILEGEDLGWSHYYASLIEQYEEITNLITISIRSVRFGKKVELTVPSEMRVWALTRMITKALALPQQEFIEGLGISVQFVYTLIADAPLKNNQTLIEAGLDNGAELNVQVDVIIRDPHLEKLDAELQKMYSTFFSEDPGPEWYERRQLLAKEVAGLRQKFYDKYSEEILEIPWFAHIDELGEDRAQ